MFQKSKSLPSSGVYKRKYTSSSDNTSKRGRCDDKQQYQSRQSAGFSGVGQFRIPRNSYKQGQRNKVSSFRNNKSTADKS